MNLNAHNIFLRQLRSFLKCVLIASSPVSTLGAVSTEIAWSPSAGTNVTGYNVYYGTNSHVYTKMISVGAVTNAAIENLLPETTYFFSLTAHDAAGNEGNFSSETSFAGYAITPNSSGWRVNTQPDALSNDQLTFSLAADAPAGAIINPTNGVLTWMPGFNYANSTNTINVLITDLSNPAASTQATIIVTVSDYLILTMTSVPVQTSQDVSLPLGIMASDGITNLTVNLNWPGNCLLHPALTFNAPIAGGTLENQGTNLLIQLWTANGDVLTGTNAFAQISCQAAAGQPSAFLPLKASSILASKSDGSAFKNTVSESGEVVVIGRQPLLRPQSIAGQGRVLSLYANPEANYQLLSSTNLLAPVVWQPVQNFQPTNLLQTLSLASSEPVIFYRLVQQ